MILLHRVIACIVEGTTIFNGLATASLASWRDNGLVASKAWSGLFQAAFRDSRNAMCLADDARHIVDVNGACLRLLGYRRFTRARVWEEERHAVLPARVIRLIGRVVGP